MRLEEWLDIRQRHASGEAIKAIARVKGISRNTVRRALSSDEPPVRAPRPAAGSVVDAVEPAIVELLAADPLVSAAEIARRLAWPHSMTVLKDRVRVLRPRLARHEDVPAAAVAGLPTDLSSFVGRGAELGAIREALRSRRLVSLVGPGGVGKTRLAHRAAAAAHDAPRVPAFDDGVRVVELAALREPDLLAQSVLDSLNVADSDAATGDAVPVLVAHLRHRDLLLVLDNCEHLLDAVAALVVALLGAAPRLRVLLTSRQALGVAGEHLVEVAPLGVPATMPAAVADALTHPAIALFVDRAASVLPGFVLDERTMADVVELCRRLDGIPLAIELAVVRLRVLSVRQLLDRVEDRFAVLTDGDRAGPARHRTLQATIAWSYDLCTAQERALWARAGVFPGPFDIEALDAVCTDREVPGSALLDGVTGLAAKSILIRDEDQAGRDLGVRFRMLETVREFGHDQLPAELDGPLRGRHRDHYVALAGALSQGWFGPDQDVWARRMKAEQPNLRAALDHALREPGSGQAALRLVGEPWFLWATSLSMTEHRRWLQRALAVAPEPSRERARALVTCALVASLQGDQAAAAALVDDGLEIARALGDDAGTANATHITGMVAFFTDDFARAAVLMAQARDGYRATGAGGDLVGALDVHVGLLDISRGRLAEARERLTATRERSVAAGESWIRAYATDGLGFIALLSDELAAARRHARESLELISRFDDTIGLSLALDLSAWTAAAGEEHERAAILLGAASARWRSFGAQLYGSPDWQSRREGYQQQARRRLGNPSFEAAFRHGAAMSRPDMLGYALGAATRPDLPERMDALTPREREIAGLVADGLTNRQIAQRLVLSHRTVEGHVARMLGKLGFGRRAQLAAWVGRVPPR